MHLGLHEFCVCRNKTDISNIAGEEVCLQQKVHQISQLTTELICSSTVNEVFISFLKLFSASAYLKLHVLGNRHLGLHGLCVCKNKTDISNTAGEVCLQVKDHQISQLTTELICCYTANDVFMSFFKNVFGLSIIQITCAG